MPETAPKKISLVVPVFNEQETIGYLFDALATVISKQASYRWELILVDDGSSDATVARIAEEHGRFPYPVVLVRLSRNFGHQAALAAGLARVSGDAVICLDADLQDPPELFAEFLAHFEKGYDVVYAVRRTRTESYMKRACYSMFYRLLKRVASIDIPLDAGDFGLMSRRVVDLLTSIPESDLFLRGLRSWLGFRQIGVPYDRPGRLAGETKYTLGKLVKLASSALFGFSLVPLRLATLLGVFVLFLAAAYFVSGAVSKMLYNNTPPGWASLVGFISLLSGAQLVFLGILGEYVGRIYAQTKGRPLFVVAREEVYPPGN